MNVQKKIWPELCAEGGRAGNWHFSPWCLVATCGPPRPSGPLGPVGQEPLGPEGQHSPGTLLMSSHRGRAQALVWGVALALGLA